MGTTSSSSPADHEFIVVAIATGLSLRFRPSPDDLSPATTCWRVDGRESEADDWAEWGTITCDEGTGWQHLVGEAECLDERGSFWEPKDGSPRNPSPRPWPDVWRLVE